LVLVQPHVLNNIQYPDPKFKNGSSIILKSLRAMARFPG
jgi:hypothetical protein